MTRQEQAQQFRLERKFVTANSPRQMGVNDATNDLGYHCPFPDGSEEARQYLAGFNSVLFTIVDPETDAYLGQRTLAEVAALGSFQDEIGSLEEEIGYDESTRPYNY